MLAPRGDVRQILRPPKPEDFFMTTRRIEVMPTIAIDRATGVLPTG
jgi:hypothetical protein